MSNKIKGLTEKRGVKNDELHAFRNTAIEEKRDLTGDELDKISGLRNEIDLIDRNIQEETRAVMEAGRKLDNLSTGEKRDIAAFSISKFLRELPLGKFDGVEREMVEEGERDARASGITPKGHMLPFKAVPSLQKRDMTATGGSGLDQGGMTIETNKSNLLEELFDAQVAVQAGATVLTNLVGNFDVPRLVEGTVAVKKAENTAAQENSPTTAQVSFAPNRLPTYIEVSNQLLIQSNERALITLLNRHMASGINAVMEKAYYHGGGTNEAVGVANTTGIGSVSTATLGAALDYSDIVNLQKEVSQDNANVGSLAFITNSKVEAALKQAVKVSSTDSQTLIDPYRAGHVIDGMDYHVTNAVRSDLTKSSTSSLSAIFYGNWGDLWIAQWGGIEFLTNPYIKDIEGLTRINASIYYDANVVRPVSFSACVDAVAS